MTALTSRMILAGRVPSDARNLRHFVMALFSIFGGITNLNDVIIPKLK